MSVALSISATSSAQVQVLLADPAHIGLATVVQIADLEALTGWVEVSPYGRIYTHEGQVVGAVCGELEGLDAWFELFVNGEPDGLAMTSAAHAYGDVPLGGVMQMILEAARRSDEWKRLAPCVGSAASAQADDAAPTRALLDVLDGHRTLAEAAMRAGMPRHAAAAALQKLADQGRVTLTVSDRRPPAPPPTPAPVARHDPPSNAQVGEWLDAGRDACKAGNLAEALDLLERVVRAWPEDRVAAQNLRHVRRLIREREP